MFATAERIKPTDKRGELDTLAESREWPDLKVAADGEVALCETDGNIEPLGGADDGRGTNDPAAVSGWVLEAAARGVQEQLVSVG